MPHKTTSYPLTSPRPLWDGLAVVQNPERTINDEALVAVAKHVFDEARPGDLTPEQRQFVEEYIPEDYDDGDGDDERYVGETYVDGEG